MKPSNNPHKAKTLSNNAEAWWYENKGSIDIFIYFKGKGEVQSCRINKRDIKRWLARVEGI